MNHLDVKPGQLVDKVMGNILNKILHDLEGQVQNAWRF